MREYKYKDKITSLRPNSSKEPPRKERIETSEFRRPRERWSNGFRARSLFRTPERRADEREKKTIEGTERTALEEAMAAKDARDRGILNPHVRISTPTRKDRQASFPTPTALKPTTVSRLMLLKE